MKKLTLCVLMFACLLLVGCKSKTGRQNIQYIRPVEDTTVFDDITEEVVEGADTTVDEEYEDLGKIPGDDYNPTSSEEIEREMNRFLSGQ